MIIWENGDVSVRMVARVNSYPTPNTHGDGWRTVPPQWAMYRVRKGGVLVDSFFDEGRAIARAQSIPPTLPLSQEIRWMFQARQQMTKQLALAAGQPCPDCRKYGYQWSRCPVDHKRKET